MIMARELWAESNHYIYSYGDWKETIEIINPRDDIKELFDKISNNKEFISVSKMVTWLNETQRDPRLNEILHPLYTMDEDSEMCIFNFLKDIYAKVDIDDTNLMKVTKNNVKLFC